MPGMPAAGADTSGVPVNRTEAERLGITFARATERPVRSSVRAVGVLKYAEPSLVYVNARGAVESVLRSYQVGRAEFLTLLSVEDARYRAELEAVAVAADYQAQLVMLRQLTAGETLP